MTANTTSQAAFCASCGEPNIAGGRFCGECGAQHPGQSAPAQANLGVPAAGGHDKTIVWTLAFAPLLGLLGAAAATTASGVDLIGGAWIITVIVNYALVVWDEKRLRGSGLTTPGSIYQLLVPLYLFRRASMLRESPAYGIVWLVTFAGSIALTGVVSALTPGQLDMTRVAASINAKLPGQVTCPSSEPAAAGRAFTCLVDGTDGTQTLIAVTVQNKAGDIVWQSQG